VSRWSLYPQPMDDFDSGMKSLIALSKADNVTVQLPKLFETIDLSAWSPRTSLSANKY
jgi:hypothetical protein